jgi:general secretion pathway protein D
MVVRALEQKTGADLMSAPKLTVVSGKKAEIIVAREFRYPESYGPINSAVGMSSSLATGGSAGVTITAGTPQNFVTRRVGVQMEVTPTVEHEGQCISLCLEPKVTEFEGFVEYGGSSIAISGGTTVNVPSGFYQPIFSTREMRTEVTIKNGETVIMGGLTREEKKSVQDAVPILSDLPIVGRLFQSKGETNQKRNLLIFVTGTVI